MVCELGPHRIASLEPHRSIDSVDRKEGEGIRTDKCPHALEVVGRGQQLVSFRRVNTVIIGVGNRRRGYAEVYFAGAGIAHHLHDLARGRAADDGIVNEHDTLAADDGAIGRVLHAHALIANRLCRLNEGTADIVIADNAKFVRYADSCAKPIAAGTPESGTGTITSALASASRASPAPMVLRTS